MPSPPSPSVPCPPDSHPSPSQVTFKDPESGEEIETGLVRVKALRQTQGGVKIDVGSSKGAGGGFGGEKAEGGDDDGDDGGDDAEETKLDQFWNFPGIENEHTFSGFADFKKNYWMPYLVAWQKCSVDKGLAKDEGEMKKTGKMIASNTLKWVKTYWDELQFFGPQLYFMDGTEVDAKYEGSSFCTNLAIVRYDVETAYFYFIKPAFKVRARRGVRPVCVLGRRRAHAPPPPPPPPPPPLQAETF